MPTHGNDRPVKVSSDASSVNRPDCTVCHGSGVMFAHCELDGSPCTCAKGAELAYIERAWTRFEAVSAHLAATAPGSEAHHAAEARMLLLADEFLEAFPPDADERPCDDLDPGNALARFVWDPLDEVRDTEPAPATMRSAT